MSPTTTRRDPTTNLTGAAIVFLAVASLVRAGACSSSGHKRRR
jgi:hypothetical protein